VADISFPSFPSSWRLPLFWAELDPSQAGVGLPNQPSLIVGQGSVPIPAGYDYPIAIGSVAKAAQLFGQGSMLARMVSKYLRINPVGVLYVYPLTDPAAGVVATGSVTITAAPTDYGTLSLYVAGQRLQVLVTSSDTPATVATALAAALNANTYLPITAAVDGTTPGKVNFTTKWKGATGNDILIIPNFGGTLAGEAMPSGLALTVAPMAGGTGAPDMTGCVAALADNEYDFVAMPYTDTASLQVWDAEFGFSAAGRWGWLRELYGSVFSARRDTYAGHMAWGPTGNSGVTTVMAVEAGSPAPVWEWTAAYTAQAAQALVSDPGRPLQSLELSGILPAPRSGRFSKSMLNAMAGVGLAVQAIGPSGYPLIQIEATRWQVNSYGQPDAAYGLVTTLHTLAWLLRRMKATITSKYPRHKLANDGTKFAVGQAIVTPKIIKAELISEYRQAEYLGMVENTVQFIANLVVVRNSTNPNRVDILYPPDLINGLRIFSVLAQFRLQYADQLIAS